MTSAPAALIFDMDDTLLATASLWLHAETTLLAALGHPWTPALATQYKGMNALDVAATIHRILKPILSLPDCQQLMRQTLLEAFSATAPSPMPGALQRVPEFAQHLPLALASGSPLSAIHSALKHLHLHTYFTHIISSESVSRGKPSPDVFLAAAATLHMPPSRCLVFEDSLVGVQAARAAGMLCFAIPSSHPTEIQQIATRTFTSLADINWSDISTALQLPAV